MRLEFHCVVHLNALKREEGKRAELQNKFGILYRESIMTLEETGSLSTVRCYCLLKGNTGMSLLLCGAGNENTRGELSCSEYSWGELVLAFEPGLIYLRTVSDMSARAGSKMSKGQHSGKKDKVMGQCRWGWSAESNIPPSSENPLQLLVVFELSASTLARKEVEEWECMAAEMEDKGVWERPEDGLQPRRAQVATAAPCSSGSKRGWFVLPN